MALGPKRQLFIDFKPHNVVQQANFNLKTRLKKRFLNKNIFPEKNRWTNPLRFLPILAIFQDFELGSKLDVTRHGEQNCNIWFKRNIRNRGQKWLKTEKTKSSRKICPGAKNSTSW